MGNNPRRANGHRRNQLRNYVRKMGLPCHICGAPIDYGLKWPDDWSYELDEIVPVSRYWEGGYSTPEACALDPENVAPAHRICNRIRSNKPYGQIPVCDPGELPPITNSRLW